jgi:hypothetical protein
MLLDKRDRQSLFSSASKLALRKDSAVHVSLSSYSIFKQQDGPEGQPDSLAESHKERNALSPALQSGGLEPEKLERNDPRQPHCSGVAIAGGL